MHGQVSHSQLPDGRITPPFKPLTSDEKYVHGLSPGLAPGQPSPRRQRQARDEARQSKISSGAVASARLARSGAGGTLAVHAKWLRAETASPGETGAHACGSEAKRRINASGGMGAVGRLSYARELPRSEP